ncbi:MAG: ABC transporter ATP-binding protein [Alphaproteobacteria bacterium]|nr:ABC transporter ATP-binding protein [Alphaproteobacteria bacterium]
MAPAFLAIDEVAKSFAGVSAVDGVTLAIERGEIFALLGPSGCGKSTLLRMIAGFEAPDAGRIVLDGEDLGPLPPYRRPVNMMFQSYALFPHMTVAGNIAFGLKQEGLPAPAIGRRVAEMLRLVRLEGLAERRPHQLSGGQRQRVALARALAKRPKLVLLDEPLAALDRKLREETQFELLAIHRRLGTTFVIVTHDQDEAMTLAHRLAVMDRGRVVQVGPPREVYEHPATRFVATFIGTANLLDGRVTDAAGGVMRVESAAAAAELSVLHDGAVPPGAAVSVAVRPEKLRLGNGMENTLTGEVEELAFRGDATLCRVRLSSGVPVTLSLPNRERTGAFLPRPGERTRLGFAAADAVLLTS